MQGPPASRRHQKQLPVNGARSNGTEKLGGMRGYDFPCSIPPDPPIRVTVLRGAHLGRDLGASLGALDPVTVSLEVLVVRSVVLGLGHGCTGIIKASDAVLFTPRESRNRRPRMPLDARRIFADKASMSTRRYEHAQQRIASTMKEKLSATPHGLPRERGRRATSLPQRCSRLGQPASHQPHPLVAIST